MKTPGLIFVILIATTVAEGSGADIRHQLAADVSAERIENDIQKLVGFGTRHTLSETVSNTRGIGAARRWIEEEFNRIAADCAGCLEVITVSDVVSGEPRIPEPTEVVSVIAIQRGSLDPDRIVMMSGDIDSRVSDPLDGVSDSPGANDNASGMAGTLEAARVLSKHRFAGTIVYAGLSGEEQGLFGGKILAAHALENGWRIKAVLNNDMIGNISGIDGVIDNSTARVFSEGTRYVETAEEARQRRFSGGEVDSASRNLARYVDRMADEFIPGLDVMMIYRLDRFARGGHHRPFNEAGMPGVRIMETHEHYDRQHQDLRTEGGVEYGDVIEGVNFDYARKLTALNVVTLAGLASAPPFPAGVSIEGAVQPSTTLNWDVATGKAAENLAGYKVYWRLTTDAQWTRSRDVGMVQTYTLENIVVDNYFFGVASVSKDGHESPVVFPGPAGSFGD
ncbi:MAG: M28 family metallopeptidase [Gammaproteobacteria bacterium]|nr:M28 family metallopeptidase [Gammaproteobacteria bacterium]MDH4315310.1 M28 family metallopeptidase [Gammaproteobacteria bacterium]MDH5213425.1 M28 family metallopeptidase [Gammaproteobacteria bacterium]